MLLLVLGVWSYDTGAYFTGKRFGTTRFLTHISPSKTHAGLIGGLVAATLVVGLLLWGSASRRSPPSSWVRSSVSPHRPATSRSRCSSGLPERRTRAR